MSELISVEQLNMLPAHLQNFFDEDEFAEVTGGSAIPRLSIKGRQFTECGVGPDGSYKMPVMRRFSDENGQPVEVPASQYNVIILGIGPSLNTQKNAKSYYVDSFGTDDEATLPNCFSHDGVKPDPSVAEPVHNSCVTCPYNAWGSDIKDGKPREGKRCKDHKLLYFVKPQDIEGQIWVLRVPATSLKMLNKYLLELKKHRLHYHVCATTMEFVEGVQFPQVRFKFGGYGTEQEILAVKQRAQSDEFAQIINKGMVYEVPKTEVVSDIPPPPAHISSPAVDPMTDEVWGAPEPVTAPVVEKAPEPITVEPALTTQDGGEVDVTGTPWDARIHSGSKSKNSDGTWRKMRGVSDEKFNAVMAELKGAKPAPVVEAKPEPTPSVFESDNAATASGDDDLDELLAGLDL